MRCWLPQTVRLPMVDVTLYLVDAHRLSTLWKVLPEYWGEAPGRR